MQVTPGVSGGEGGGGGGVELLGACVLFVSSSCVVCVGGSTRAGVVGLPFLVFVLFCSGVGVGWGWGGVWMCECVDRGRVSAGSVAGGPGAPHSGRRGAAGSFAFLFYVRVSIDPSAVRCARPGFGWALSPAPRALPCRSRRPSGGPPPHATPIAGATAAHAIPAVPPPHCQPTPGRRVRARAPLPALP